MFVKGAILSELVQISSPKSIPLKLASLLSFACGLVAYLSDLFGSILKLPLLCSCIFAQDVCNFDELVARFLGALD